MAKFKDLNLLLQEEQRILFGDDTMTDPINYPATSTTQKAMISYTTISGYNETAIGGTVLNIPEVEEFVISMPIAGERASEEYHLVRYDQLEEWTSSIEQGDWQESVLTISGSPPGAPSDGDRYLVDDPADGSWTGLEDYIVEWNTVSGTWDTTMPNEGMTTFVEDINKYYVYKDGDWAPMGEGIDHGDLVGLEDDDHLQYVPTDASRGFTNTVSGIDPVEDYHLATKWYIDDALTSISGGTFDHGGLSGLEDDDHLQYILVDGTRGFTGTVSGIDPTEDAHLTTKSYVDTEITNVTNLIPTDHDELNGLGDDDHLQYILVDGTRGFTGTVSGIDPTVDEHLTTKWYVDDAITTATGSLTSDHGDLTGLTDDDHPQYTLADGTRAFTGTVSGIDPTEDQHLTTKFYVDNELTGYVDLTSAQTISGSKTFADDTVFGGDIDYGAGTISGTGDIYTGNIYADNQKWGRIAVIDNARDQAVTFGTAWPDDDYTVVATLTNEVDGTPSIYSTIQGVKDGTGFTTHFSGKIDSADFVLEWHAFYGQFN